MPEPSVYEEMGMKLFETGCIFGGRLKDAIRMLQEVGERRGIKFDTSNINPVQVQLKTEKFDGTLGLKDINP